MTNQPTVNQLTAWRFLANSPLQNATQEIAELRFSLRAACDRIEALEARLAVAVKALEILGTDTNPQTGSLARAALAKIKEPST